MKSMLRLGSLLFLVFLALGFTPGAHADSWQLRIGEFTSSHGHTLSLGSLISWWAEDVYPSIEDCHHAGEKRLRDFHGGVLPDGSRTLPTFWCERVGA